MFSISSKVRQDAGLALRAGFTLVESMVAVSLALLLSLSTVGVLFMNWNSFQYNQISNANLTNAQLAMQQLVYGGKSGMWGLKQAMATETTITRSGTLNAYGNPGWSVAYTLSVVPGAPAMVTTYNPVARTIVNNLAGTLATGVTDSYFFISTNNTVRIGVQVESAQGGVVDMVEAEVNFRN